MALNADFKVSVVVITYDQPERLRLVLAGLQAQTLPSSCFEIIIVDDGDSRRSREFIRGLTSHRFTLTSQAEIAFFANLPSHPGLS